MESEESEEVVEEEELWRLPHLARASSIAAAIGPRRRPLDEEDEEEDDEEEEKEEWIDGARTLGERGCIIGSGGGVPR
jgi:hypothetical protein